MTDEKRSRPVTGDGFSARQTSATRQVTASEPFDAAPDPFESAVSELEAVGIKVVRQPPNGASADCPSCGQWGTLAITPDGRMTCRDTTLPCPDERVREGIERRQSASPTQRTRLERLRGLLYDRDELDTIQPPTPLIRGVLDVGTLAVLAGKFGTYKTFVALDWACSLATGRDWFGHEVPEPAPVLYVAAEGLSGARGRVHAWETGRADGARVPAKQLHVIGGNVNLGLKDDVEALGELITEKGARLVVLDTLHRCAPGLDENSSQDMGKITDAVFQLRERYGCTILLCHHTGHSGTRSRGSSAIEDDADASWVSRLSKDDDEDRSAANLRTLVHRKTKDSVLTEDIPLELVAVGESAYLRKSSAPTLANGLLVPELARRLDQLGVERDLSVIKTKNAAEEHDLPRQAGDVWRQVAKARKGPAPVDLVPNPYDAA